MSKEEYIEYLVENNYISIATNENLHQPEDMSNLQWFKLAMDVIRLVSNYYYDDEKKCITDWDEWLNEIFFTIKKETGDI